MRVPGGVVLNCWGGGAAQTASPGKADDRLVTKVNHFYNGGRRTSRETRYYLLSQPFAPERFNDIVRSHWGIENELHWRLDVVFNEDQARNRKGHCAANLALLRKMALNLARLEPSKGSMRGKLKRAGWDNDFLVAILVQFANPLMR